MCQTTYLTKRSPCGTRSVGKPRTPVSTTIAILSLLLPQGYSILINIYGKPSLSHPSHNTTRSNHSTPPAVLCRHTPLIPYRFYYYYLLY